MSTTYTPRYLISAAVLTATLGTASATNIYASKTAMESAPENAGLTFATLNFGTPQTLLTTLTVSGVTFSVTSGSFEVVDSTTIKLAGGSGSSLQVSLAPGTLAWGADFSGNGPTLITIAFDGDSIPVSNGGTIAPFYFGAGVTTGFGTINLTSTVGQMVFSNFEVGLGAPIGGDAPEVSTLLMMSGGLISLGLFQKRRKRALRK